MQNWLKKLRLNRLKDSRVLETVKDYKVRKRFIAAFMAVVMVVTSMQFSELFVTDAVAEGESTPVTPDLGIINNRYSDETAGTTGFYLRFYKTVDDTTENPQFAKYWTVDSEGRFIAKTPEQLIDGGLTEEEIAVYWNHDTETGTYSPKNPNPSDPTQPVYDYETTPRYLTHQEEVRLNTELLLKETDSFGAYDVYLEPFESDKGNYIGLQKGMTLDFLSLENSGLKDFLWDNNITQIDISYDTAGNDDYYYYGNSLEDPADPETHVKATYNFTKTMRQKTETVEDESGTQEVVPVTDINGVPVMEVDPSDTFNVTGLSAVTFTSTDLAEYDVTVKWRDSGEHRTGMTPSDINVKVQRKSGSGDYADADMSEISGPVTSQKSNSEWEYDYTVPQYDEDGNKYSYTAAETTVLDSDYFKVEEPENETDGFGTTITNVGLRTFDCTIRWNDAAHSDVRPSASEMKTRFATYFKLYNDDDDTERTVAEDDIIVTDNNDGTYSIQVKNLEEIDANSKAKSYYLKSVAGKETVAASEMVGAGKTYTGIEDDTFYISGKNTGVNSNVTDRVYQNGEVNVLLQGDTTFKGTLHWVDAAEQTSRISKGDNIGDFLIYRYVGTDKDMYSQVGSFSIPNRADDEYSFTYSKDGTDVQLPKYDNTGSLYYYFAKEKLNLGGDYSVQYTYDNQSAEQNKLPDPFTNYFPNGARVTNTLHGSVVYSVDAKWIAAALQGGTASVTYKLQKFEDNEWKDVTPANSVTIDNFSAEVMEKARDFAVVEKYDASVGNIQKYRIVQTSISRTDDNSSAQTNNTEIEMMSDDAGVLQTAQEDGRTRVKLADENPDGNKVVTIGDHRFLLKVYKLADNSFQYVYTLADTIDVRVDKDWSPVPKTSVNSAWSSIINLQILKLDYATGTYVHFDSAHGNPGNLEVKYIDSANSNTLHVDTLDQNGTISVKRADVYEDGNANNAGDHFAKKIYGLPKYDEDGHENRYYVTEVGSFPNSSSRDSVDTDSNPRKLLVTNNFGGNGERIDFAKIWLDDGEEEYKSDVAIEASVRVFPLPAKDNEQETVTGWETEEDSSKLSSLSSYTAESDEDYYRISEWNLYKHWKDTLYVSEGLGKYQDGTSIATDGTLVKDKFPGVSDTIFDEYQAYYTKIISNDNKIDDTVCYLSPDVTLNDKNVWMGELPVRLGYTASGRYNLKDFREYLTSSRIKAHNYTEVDGEIVAAPKQANFGGMEAQIAQDGENTITFAATTSTITTEENGTIKYGSNWIDVREQALSNYDYIKGGNTVQAPLTYSWLAGIYEATYDDAENDYRRYYAVQEVPSTNNSGKLEKVTFKNTRVGLVNVRARFNWNVGSWMTDNKINTVTLKLMADYGNGDGYQPIKINGNEKFDINTPGGITEYYIRNLPKYANNGVIIKYKLEEVKVNGHDINNSGNCTLTDAGKDFTCHVNVDTSLDYINNQKSNSGDIIPIEITNSFTGNTEFTVNKIWKDDSNALNTRSDLYIRLRRHSTDPDENSSEDPVQGLDYRWVDNGNEWTYTYTGLNRFDAKGYEYIYYVVELNSKLAANEYVTTYTNTNGSTAGVNYAAYNGIQVAGATSSDDVYVKKLATTGTLRPVIMNGGTIENKLVNNMSITGHKYWQNIDSSVLNVDYPIADIFLYKKVKKGTTYTSATYSTIEENKVKSKDRKYDLAYSTKTKIGEDEQGVPIYQYYDVELINICKIFEGETTYSFGHEYSLKKTDTLNTTDKDANDHSIYGYLDKSYLDSKDAYDAEGNYIFNGSGVELPKYDDNGALIDYFMEERAIEGYNFELGNGKITNEYTGGKSVHVEFTKNWQNMTEVYTSYPTIRVTLHEAYIGTSSTNPNTPELKDYASFDKTFRPSDFAAAAASHGSVSYEFGNHIKEELKQYAPDGNEFYYYFTEELIDAQGNGRATFEDNHILVSEDDLGEGKAYGAPQGESGYQIYIKDNAKYRKVFPADPSGMIDFETVSGTDSNRTITHKKYCILVKIAESDGSTYKDVKHEGLGFFTTIDEVVNKTTQSPDSFIEKESTITNRYEPDDKNFASDIIVNKEWKNHTENNKNGTDYSGISGYSFILKRKTRHITEKSIFRVNTGEGDQLPTLSFGDDSDDEFIITGPQGLIDYKTYPDQIVFNPGMDSEADSNDQAYHEADIYFKKNAYSQDIQDKIKVTIRVYDDSKKVVISGLAVFGQDGVGYTYIVKEIVGDAYKPEKETTEVKINTAEGEGYGEAVFNLKNELKVFALRLNKLFGKQTSDNAATYEAVRPEEYDSFFNTAYIDRLKFTLQRRKKAGSGDSVNPWENYKDNIYLTAHKRYTSGDNQGIYYYEFTALPCYSSDNVQYEYRIVENDSAGSHVRISYPAGWDNYSASITGSNEVGSSGIVGEESNNVAGSKIVSTTSIGSTQNTFVRNIFMSKEISLDKYWDDDNNADGMRPEELQVKIYEKVPTEGKGSEQLPSPNPVTINETLTNADNWHKVVALPMYYYNGDTPIDGLSYTIREADLSNTMVEVPSYDDTTGEESIVSKSLHDLGYTMYDYGYVYKTAGTGENPYVTERFTLSGEGTSVFTAPGASGTERYQAASPPKTGDLAAGTSAPSGQSTEIHESTTENNYGFVGLYLMNTKPRVDSKLTFEKTWDDNNNAWNSRPENVYIKIIRYTKDANGEFSDPEVVKKENDDLTALTGDVVYAQDSTKNRTVTADANGVFTIPVLPTDSSKFNVIIDKLAFGTATGTPLPSAQNNGDWNQYYYTVVECDAYGNDIQTTLTDNNETDNTNSENTSVSAKVSFDIDLSGYQSGSGKRDYINIKLVRTRAGESGDDAEKIVCRDVTGMPVKATVTIPSGGVSSGGDPAYTQDCYAVIQSAPLADGVIVLQFPPNATIAHVEIDNLALTDGNGSVYEYNVYRCKANGGTHPTSHLPSSVETTFTKTENTTKDKTKYSFTMSWDAAAASQALKPNTFSFELYKKTGDTVTKVTDAGAVHFGSTTISPDSNGIYTLTVPTDSDTISAYFDKLPSGEIVAETLSVDGHGNTGTDGVWNKTIYYIKQCTGTEVEIASNWNYTWKLTDDEPKPFTLGTTNLSTDAALSETITNKLRDKQHSVTKVWDDNNDEYSTRDGYKLVLQQREGDTGTWTDLGLDNVTVKRGDETVAISASQTEVQQTKDQLELNYSNLPAYSKNGILYQYRVVEKYIGNNQVLEQKSYLFHVETDAEDVSYITKWNRGTSNYYVGYNYDTADYNYSDSTATTITNKVVTDSVSYGSYKAVKVWDDEKNLYGKRPSNITFILKRRIITDRNTNPVTKVEDSEYALRKTVGEADNWEFTFTKCAAFDKEGRGYEYYIEEVQPALYTPKEGDPELGEIQVTGESIQTSTFTNTYVPDRKPLTLTKTWDDIGDRFSLRPASVKFELRCRYDIYEYDNINDFTASYVRTFDGPVYDGVNNSAVYESFSTEQRTTFYNLDIAADAVDGKFQMQEADPGSVTNTWTLNIPDTILPAYVNVAARSDYAKNNDGDYIKNGVSVPVTYYIREYLPETGVSDYNYGSYKEYKDLPLYPYVPSDDTNASIASAHILPIKIENLPRKNGTGSSAVEYEYKLYTCNSTGDNAEEVSASDVQIIGDTVTILANVQTTANAQNTYIIVKSKLKGADDSTLTPVTVDAGSQAVKAVFEVMPKDSDPTSTASTRSYSANGSAVITIPNTEPVENSPSSRGVFLLNKTGSAAPVLSIGNRLDTRDIVVTKKWNDNGYTGTNPSLSTLHYDIDATLYCDSLLCSESTMSESGLYKETKMIPETTDTTEKGVVFRGLPKYGKNGTEFVYSVKEAVADNTHTAPYDVVTADYSAGYDSVSVTYPEAPSEPKVTSITETSPTPSGFSFEVQSFKYGYEGDYKLFDDSSDSSVRFCEITNSLPVAEFEANMYWNDEQNRDGKRLDEADVVLSREATRTRDRRQVTQTTDWDYIYFTDPHNSDGGTWVDGNDPDLSKIKMVLINDSDPSNVSYSAEIDAVGSFVNGIIPEGTGYMQNVYKFQVPDDVSSYTKVMFKTSNSDKNTVWLNLDGSSENYRGGWNYYPSAVSSGTTYVCESVGGETNPFQYAPNTKTSTYYTDGRKIYIKINNNDSNYLWDDPHVYFFDSSVVGQEWPGYIPEYEREDPDDHHAIYSIEIPEGATKFILNNGEKSKKKNQKVIIKTTDTIIVPGETYRFSNGGYSTGENVGYRVYSLKTIGTEEGVLDVLEPLDQIAVQELSEPTTDEGKALAYWTGSFVKQILYNEDNVPYTYRISEKDNDKISPDTTTTTALTNNTYTYEYSHAITMDNGSGDVIIRSNDGTDVDWILSPYEVLGSDKETVYTAAHTTGNDTDYPKVTFSVRNNHTPVVRDLKVQKQWVGDDTNEFREYTRPTTVTFEVYCEVSDKAKCRIDTTAAKAILGDRTFASSYIVSGDSSTMSWTLQDLVGSLPVYYNGSGTEVLNGSAERIKYTLVEINNPGYTVVYSPVYTQLSESNASETVTATNTLVTQTITVHKIWDDGQYTGNGTHYNISATVTPQTGSALTTPSYTVDVANDTNSYTTIDLPIYMADGVSKVRYILDETTKHYGYTDSYCTTENGTYSGENLEFTTDNENLYIKNTLPVRHYRAEKIWDDNDNRDGLRPESITFTLTRSTTDTDTTHNPSISNEQTANKFTYGADFGYYPTNAYDNSDYTYSVTEAAVTGYTTTGPVITTNTQDANDVYENVYKFTNSHTPESGQLTVNKTWVDDTAAFGYNYSTLTRPGNVTVKLQCSIDGAAPTNAETTSYVHDFMPSDYQYTRTIGSGESWQTVFTGLPVYANTTYVEGSSLGEKKTITYSVVETPVTNYTTTYSPTTGKALTAMGHAESIEVTNTLITKSVTIKKSWDSPPGFDYTHYPPVTARIVMQREGEEEVEVYSALTIPDNDTGVTIQLPTSIGSKLTSFTVTETSQHYNYQATYRNGNSGDFVSTLPAFAPNNNTITIKNTLPTMGYSAEKFWDDENNRDGKRPLEISFTLQRSTDGTNYDNVGDLTANEANNWKVDFGQQLTHDYNNTQYQYQVIETGPASPYAFASQSQTNSGQNINYEFRNTYTPMEDTLKVVKIWDDNGFSSSTRPDGSTVELELWCQYIINGVTTEKIVSDENRVKDHLIAKGSYSDTTAAPYVMKVTVADGFTGTDGFTYEKTIDHLPVNINTTGNEKEAGTYSDVTYFVKETTVHNGYSVSYSNVNNGSSYVSAPSYTTGIKLNGDNTGDETVYVKNTLNTRDITVSKNWNDGGYGSDLHYKIDVTLKNSSLDCSIAGKNEGGHYKETKPIEINGGYITFKDLPMYFASGSEIVYDIEEKVYGPDSNANDNATPLKEQTKAPLNSTQSDYNSNFTVTDHKYGYIGSCVATKTDGVVTALAITNRLPLTSVNVTKEWEDKLSDRATGGTVHDYSSFRPDNITVKLQHGTDGTTWTDIDTTHNSLSIDKPGGSADSTATTYDKLLKYTEDNTEYLFKVTETNVPKAYTVRYAQQITTSESNALKVVNTLMTRDVTIRKTWNDNGYQTAHTDNLHYALAYTMKNTATADLAANKLEYTAEQTVATYADGDASTAGNGGSIVIKNVPVYDISGNVIPYTFTETPKTGSVNGGNPYGYITTGAATNYPAVDYDSHADVVQQYDFTNTLPLTTVNVTKTWNFDTEFHTPIKSDTDTVTVTLTRSAGGLQDSFTSSKSDLSQGTSVAFDKLLIADSGNQQYTYRVTETPVPGYSTSYTGNDIAAVKDASPTVAVTNTQKTGDVKLQKIDYTYYKRHSLESGYTDKPVNDVFFKLYIKDGANEVAVPVTQQTGGYYQYEHSRINETDCNIIKSQTVSTVDGILDIRGLPLNTYYLKEIDDSANSRPMPTAYQQNETEFQFTVGVDSNNNVVKSFKSANDSSTAVKDNDGFLGRNINDTVNIDIEDRIGNEETPRTLTIHKQDETDGRALKDATYYLLYLIPFEVRTQTAITDEGVYKTNAANAVKTSNGLYSDEVKKYWDIERVVQTDNSGQYTTSVGGVGGLRFGTYAFLEVQAPIGYGLNNQSFYSIAYTKNDSSVVTTTNPDTILLTLGDINIGCEVIHKDPRKNVNAKLLKRDEYGNPLNNATFDLYYLPGAHATTQTERESSLYFQRTDFDYIFFTDNKYYKEGDTPSLNESNTWINSDNSTTNKIFAYFYRDDNGTHNKIGSDWPGQEMWEKWVNDDGNTVYKIQPPEGATHVVFSNVDTTDSSINTKVKAQTVDIHFDKGFGYYKTGHTTESGIDKYTVKSWRQAYPLSIAATQLYSTYYDFIQVKISASGWDDLHIQFFNESSQPITQPDPGYYMNATGTNDIYQIPIPVGAKYFKLNNGHKDETKGHNKYTVPIAVESYVRYEISEGSNPYTVKVIDTNLENTVSTPVTPRDPEIGHTLTPIKVATIVTGDDGLNKEVTIIDADYATEGPDHSVTLKKWGHYFYKEVTAPTGYEKGGENQSGDYVVNFDIGANEADQSVFVSNAQDSRKKGTVVLTKTAKEAAGAIKIGDPLSGAEFELYKVDSSTGDKTKLSVYKKKLVAEYKYMEVTPLEFAEYKDAYETDGTVLTPYDTLTTDSSGKIKIEGLDWGDYCLTEITAPTAYSAVDSNTNAHNEIYFTVGKNNCEEIQQLKCTDEINKAKIRITKKLTNRNISYDTAWGEPTFIFKLRQTRNYQSGALTDIPTSDQTVKTISITFDSHDGQLSKDLDVEPGEYEITEVKVARYKITGIAQGAATSGTGAEVTNINISTGTATITVPESTTAEAVYTNDIAYYDYFSHVDAQVNEFNGIKGIHVEYRKRLPVVASTAGFRVKDKTNGNDYDLIAKIIMSDGREVEMDDDMRDNLTISYPGMLYTPSADTRFEGKFQFDANTGKVTINDPALFTDSAYTLQANYKGLSTRFVVRFDGSSTTTKVEKTVEFIADKDNMSYFIDEGLRSYRYEYTFIYEEGDNTGPYEIRHNGVSLSAAETAQLMERVGTAFTINEAYRAAKQLNGWKKDSSTTSPAISQLIDVMNAAAAGSTITYQAVLEPKS